MYIFVGSVKFVSQNQNKKDGGPSAGEASKTWTTFTACDKSFRM